MGRRLGPWKRGKHQKEATQLITHDAWAPTDERKLFAEDKKEVNTIFTIVVLFINGPKTYAAPETLC